MKNRIEASEYFAILPEAVLFAPISSNAVRLYCILRRRADEKNNSCYPSQSYLAKHMYCSVRTVQRAAEELIDIGAITVRHRKIEETDAYTSNLYILHATIATGSAQARKDSANMSYRSGAGVVQNKAIKQSKETDTKKKPRKRDLLFESMCEGLGIDWKDATKGELGKINGALKQLREKNVTPEELTDVIKHYKDNWKVAISAPAISNNWSKLKNEMKESEPKVYDCKTSGCVWRDLEYSGQYDLFQCIYCKKEKKE